MDSPITIDALKKLAIKYSIKKYTVKNSNENLLSSDDFPYSGDVSIEAYNAPKSQVNKIKNIWQC